MATAVIIVGLVVFGAIIYLIITVIAYVGQASILDLDEESLSMIKNKTEELSFLVRVKQVNFTQTCKKYKDDDIDGQKIRISVE